MRTLPAAVAAATLAAGAATIGVSEAEHFRPVIGPVAVAGDVLRIGVVDRVADVVDTVENIIGDPDVYIGHAPTMPAHTHQAAGPNRAEAEPKNPESFDWTIVKLLETVAAGYGVLRLGRLALRRRWAPEADE